MVLGGLVDGGLHSVQVAAYLIAVKVLAPKKFFLIRGCHETREVNGDEQGLGDRCLLRQVRTRMRASLSHIDS